LCNKGFHFCENPFDVFGYYAPSNSRFCIVEGVNVSDEKESDSKKCSKKLTVNAEIGLFGLIKAGVEYIIEKVDFDNAKESNTGYQSAATNTGYNSVAMACGYKSKARAVKGSAIVVCERDDDSNLVAIKAAIIDGVILKENTFYFLVNGEFVEEV